MAKTAYVVSLFSELTILREYRAAIREAVRRGFTSESRARSMIAIGGLQPESIVTAGSLRDILPFTSGAWFRPALVSRRPSTEAIDNGARKR